MQVLEQPFGWKMSFKGLYIYIIQLHIGCIFVLLNTSMIFGNLILGILNWTECACSMTLQKVQEDHFFIFCLASRLAQILLREVFTLVHGFITFNHSLEIGGCGLQHSEVHYLYTYQQKIRVVPVYSFIGFFPALIITHPIIFPHIYL